MTTGRTLSLLHRQARVPSSGSPAALVLPRGAPRARPPGPTASAARCAPIPYAAPSEGDTRAQYKIEGANAVNTITTTCSPGSPAPAVQPTCNETKSCRTADSADPHLRNRDGHVPGLHRSPSFWRQTKSNGSQKRTEIPHQSSCRANQSQKSQKILVACSFLPTSTEIYYTF